MRGTWMAYTKHFYNRCGCSVDTADLVLGILKEFSPSVIRWCDRHYSLLLAMVEFYISNCICVYTCTWLVRYCIAWSQHSLSPAVEGFLVVTALHSLTTGLSPEVVEVQLQPSGNAATIGRHCVSSCRAYGTTVNHTHLIVPLPTLHWVNLYITGASAGTYIVTWTVAMSMHHIVHIYVFWIIILSLKSISEKASKVRIPRPYVQMNEASSATHSAALVYGPIQLCACSAAEARENSMTECQH